MPDLNAEKPRVALFRAHDDAARSATRLRRLGFSVASLPVIEAAPLAFEPKRSRYDAVIATSSKAFLGDAPIERTAPMFVVGARTGGAAIAKGWRLAAPSYPDSKRLIDALKSTLRPGAAILYLAGRERKPAIEAALGPGALEVVEVYAAKARKHWRSDEIRSLSACDFALHYSRRSAALAVRLAEAAGAGPRFRLMTHVCLSGDVAKPLEEIGAARIRIARSADEAALMLTLVEAAPVFPSSSPSRI